MVQKKKSSLVQKKSVRKRPDEFKIVDREILVYFNGEYLGCASDVVFRSGGGRPSSLMIRGAFEERGGD